MTTLDQHGPMNTSADDNTLADLQVALRQNPMTWVQIRAAALCVLLNMLDGFDLLVMAFTAPGVSAEWSMSGARMGMLLSAGLVGMALGSFLLGPLADRYGRRTLVLISMSILCVGMIASVFVRSYNELAALRVLTGLGIGGVLPAGGILISEYAAEKWRNTLVGIYTAGYPVGATLGGAIAALLIAEYGWRAAFAFGAVMSVLTLGVVWLWLPESLHFLLVRQPRNALQRVNGLLRKMHYPQLSELPAARAATSKQVGIRELFAATPASETLRHWLAFFMMMAMMYFVNSWTPKLLVASGWSAQQSITGGVLFNFGGMFGAVIFAVWCAYAALRRLTLVCLLVSALLMLALAQWFHTPGMVFVLMVGLGAFSNGVIAGLNASTARLYIVEHRTTGLGWGLVAGRLGAILAPVLVGRLIDLHWQPTELYVLFVVPVALAFWAMLPTRSRTTAQQVPS